MLMDFECHLQASLGTVCTLGGLKLTLKIHQHGPKLMPLEIELNCKNNFVCTLPQLLGRESKRLQLKKQDCQALEKIEIEMGVACLVFEPRPPNFEKMHNFQRCTNDITRNHQNSNWFQSQEKPLGVSFTDILVLREQPHCFMKMSP